MILRFALRKFSKEIKPVKSAAEVARQKRMKKKDIKPFKPQSRHALKPSQDIYDKQVQGGQVAQKLQKRQAKALSEEFAEPENLTADYREFRVLLEKMPEIMRGHEGGHVKSRFGTFALLFGSIAGCGYLIANHDTYTRWNTDGYCMLGTSFAYLAVILGPAKLQGLTMVDYRQVPRRFISLLPQSRRFLTPLPFLITAMSAAGLTMQDDLNLWYVLPIMLALGLSLTTVLIQSNAMSVPLWNVKHFMQVGIVLVIGGLSMGVAQLQAAATYHQAGTELKGIQKLLDQQSVEPKETERQMEEYRRVLSELKNPLL